jgi:hypothetical protein
VQNGAEIIVNQKRRREKREHLKLKKSNFIFKMHHIDVILYALALVLSRFDCRKEDFSMT